MFPGSVILRVRLLAQLGEPRVFASVRTNSVVSLVAGVDGVSLWTGGRAPAKVVDLPWSDVYSVESGGFEVVTPAGPFYASSQNYLSALVVSAAVNRVPVSLPFAVFRTERGGNAPFILDGYALRGVVDRKSAIRADAPH
jgi:hypothetical protein